eukprot:365660-Chlamydomonas_euryale.AAC.2
MAGCHTQPGMAGCPHPAGHGSLSTPSRAWQPVHTQLGVASGVVTSGCPHPDGHGSLSTPSRAWQPVHTQLGVASGVVTSGCPHPAGPHAPS